MTGCTLAQQKQILQMAAAELLMMHLNWLIDKLRRVHLDFSLKDSCFVGEAIKTWQLHGSMQKSSDGRTRGKRVNTMDEKMRVI